MTSIDKGIKITSAIVPTHGNDKYPTHIAEYGKGGHVTVSSVTDFLQNYPIERMTEGMTVYVQLNQSLYVLKGWTNTSERPGSGNLKPLLGGAGGGGIDADKKEIGSQLERWTGYFSNLNATSISLGDSNLEETGIQKAVIKATKLYVDPDAPSINDAYDSYKTKCGQNLNLPFKSLERALLEAARLSRTDDTADRYDQIAIVMSPGVYLIDNSPGLTTDNLYTNSFTNSTQLDKPNYYKEFVDSAQVVKINFNILLEFAFSIDSIQSLGLSDENKKLCKRDLTLLIDAIVKDLEAAGNINTTVFARGYRLPDGTLNTNYLTQSQVIAFEDAISDLTSRMREVIKNTGSSTGASNPSNPSNYLKINNLQELQGLPLSAIQDRISYLLNIVTRALDGTKNPWEDNKFDITSITTSTTNSISQTVFTLSSVADFDEGLSLRFSNTGGLFNINDKTLYFVHTVNRLNNTLLLGTSINQQYGLLVSGTFDQNNKPTIVSKQLQRGIFPSLYEFNAPTLVIDAQENIKNYNTDYLPYKKAAGVLSNNNNLVSILTQAIKAVYPDPALTNNQINSFYNDGIIASGVTAVQWKCMRDLKIVLDHLINDLLNVSNVHLLDISKLYVSSTGIRTNFLTGSTSDTEVTERASMVTALGALSTQCQSLIADTTVKSSIQTLLNILINTLKEQEFINPHSIVEDKGVRILVGGVTVPKGVSFVSTDLRKTEIRPLYIAQDDLDYVSSTTIFKVTGGTYHYGATYKDHLGAQWTHHKVNCLSFANDDWEFSSTNVNTQPAYKANYYRKLGKAFAPLADLDYYTSTSQELQIVGPAGDNDQNRTDTVKGSSPYIYNCSVRSTGGLCGAWIDGSRVTGFKSLVTAQFTQTTIQRFPKAYQKWNGTIKRWEDLNATDNYYSLKPALYSDYIHGISEANQEPTDKAIRYKRSRLSNGLIGTDWRHYGFYATNNSFVQIVSCFCIGPSEGYVVEDGGDMSITNSNTNFGETAMSAYGIKSVASKPDSDFRLFAIKKPKPLTSSDVISFNTYTVDIDSSIAWYLDTVNNPGGDRNRVYVTELISAIKVDPFTFRAGTKIHFSIGNSGTVVREATLRTEGGATFNNANGKYYFYVDSALTQNIFVEINGTNQISNYTDSTIRGQKIAAYKAEIGSKKLQIKRIVDRRTLDEKAYKLKLSPPSPVSGQPSLPKRTPPYGFLVKDASLSNAIKGKLWVADSKEIIGADTTYEVILLGYKKDNTPEPFLIEPYQISDIDYEPVVDLSGVVTSPDYNSESSSAYQAILELVNSLQLDSTNLKTPSLQDLDVSAVNKTLSFYRPSIIRCSGHTFEYSGYINYSQGLPQFQTVNIPMAARLYKNRKNVGGGLCFYSGLDHEGLNWAGDQAVNLATGKSYNLAVADAIIDITVPATFDNVQANSLQVGDVQINSSGIILQNQAELTLQGKPLVIVQSTPPIPVPDRYPAGTLALNASFDTYPLAYKLNSSRDTWIQLGSETFNNITLTGNLTAQSSGKNVVLSPTISGTTGGTVTINPTDLTIKPAKLDIQPTTTGSIKNVDIGLIQPSNAVFTELTVGGLRNASNQTGDLYVRGVVTILGGLNLETKLGGTVLKQTFINNQSEVIDSFTVSEFRSARYQIQVSQGSNHQTLDLLIIHNDVEVTFLEYGNISTGTIKITSPEVTISTGTIKTITVRLKRTDISNSAQVVYNRVILKSALVAPSKIESTEIITAG